MLLCEWHSVTSTEELVLHILPICFNYSYITCQSKSRESVVPLRTGTISLDGKVPSAKLLLGIFLEAEEELFQL